MFTPCAYGCVGKVIGSPFGCSSEGRGEVIAIPMPSANRPDEAGEVWGLLWEGMRKPRSGDVRSWFAKGETKMTLCGEIVPCRLFEGVIALVPPFSTDASGRFDVPSAPTQRPVAVDLAQRKADEIDPPRLCPGPSRIEPAERECPCDLERNRGRVEARGRVAWPPTEVDCVGIADEFVDVWTGDGIAWWPSKVLSTK